MELLIVEGGAVPRQELQGEVWRPPEPPPEPLLQVHLQEPSLDLTQPLLLVGLEVSWVLIG